MENLLGIVNLPRSHGKAAQLVIKDFKNPMFIKTSNDRVQTIRIDIRDDNHEPVQIPLGPSVVRLHCPTNFNFPSASRIISSVLEQVKRADSKSAVRFPPSR